MPSYLQILLMVMASLWFCAMISTVVYTELVRRVFLGTDVSGMAWPLPDEVPAAQGERVAFAATDGLPLQGIFVRSRDADAGDCRPLVIFSHPVGAGGGAYVKHVDWLLDEGCHVFAFDHRGHGESHFLRGYRPRQWVTEYEVADLLGAINVCDRRADVDSERIVLFGVSRGAGTALVAAARTRRVRAVVCDSAFSTWHTLQERSRKWAHVFLRSERLGRQVPWFVYTYIGLTTILLSEITERVRFAPVIRSLQRLRDRPVAFIHGGKDAYISLEQPRLFQRRYTRGRARLLEIATARHNDAVAADPEGYRQFVREFLRDSLG